MPTTPGTVAWHEMDAETALDRLGASPHGLTHEEASSRLGEYGPNEISVARGVSPWRILLHQFTSPLIYILLVAMIVTLAIGHHADAAVIAAVLVVNAVIGFIQEFRAENAMQALLEMVAPRAAVRRDGERREIEARGLVPGDIVLLESGDIVPADLRLIEESNLLVDEAILTGESVAVGKNAATLETGKGASLGDRLNMAFSGTAVASGRGRGVVVATGSRTQIGLIAGEMQATERALTPLQTRMKRFGNLVSVVILAVSVVVFFVGVSRGQSAGEMFLTAVAVAVSAIPEGLPVVMTVALAVGVRRMAKRNAIVRRLPAVETLGSCTVVLSDKTGTLTENRMTAQTLAAGGARYSFRGEGLDPAGEILGADGAQVDPEHNEPLRRALLAGVLNNEADLRRRDDGDGWRAIGDPTEVALLVAAGRAGLDRETLLDEHPRTHHVPFESDRQFSATINRGPDGRESVYVKGAPERVLEMCDRAIGAGGETPLDRESILEQADELARDGLRLLALAAGDTDEALDATRRGEPAGLSFLGLVGMIDPPRAEVRDAVRGCHRSGIRVIMCTGDHAATASAIAGRIGLEPDLEPGATPEVVTGAELARMDDDRLREVVARVRVFARMNPTQKLRIVGALRAIGEVVAVTGDGVNDAPALKAAHIGCAMGQTGTDVAKAASEMVLADDNFATIYAAVEEGRTAFSNIRKATNFLVAGAIGMVLAVLGAFVLGTPIPLLPAQILWVNVVTNGIQDVAMAFEPGERDQLERPPRSMREGVMSVYLIEQSVLVGMLFAVAAIGAYAWEIHQGMSGEYARTAATTMLVVFLALHIGSCRSEFRSIFRKSPLSNPVLLIGTLTALGVHVGSMYLGPTRALLRFEPLEARSWLTIIMFAPLVVVLVEAHKAVRGPGARRARR